MALSLEFFIDMNWKKLLFLIIGAKAGGDKVLPLVWQAFDKWQVIFINEITGLYKFTE